MKGKGERVVEYMNPGNGELLLKVVADFGLLYVIKEILWYNRYAHLFFSSNLSDAKSVPFTSVAYFFLCWKGMFPRGSYHIF